MKVNGRCISYIALFNLILYICSCSKLVEVNPPITNINGDNVFNDDRSSIAVLTGIYTNMSNSSIALTTGYLSNICFTTGLTGDELKLFNTNNQDYNLYYENNISPNESTWANIYTMIFIANSAIEKLPAGKFLTPSIRDQLLGEAKFIRALCYFYLINLYGDVPLAISSDYKINRLLPRTTSITVYEQIVSDLKEAQSLLNTNYLGADGISITAERIRPNKYVATALLSRVYLYMKKYPEAEAQATSIINNSSFFYLVDLNSVFLMNNKEAIWQLQPVGIETENTANTREGQLFNLLDLGSVENYVVYLNEDLVNSFEKNDQRKLEWINSLEVNNAVYFFPTKYKIGLQGQGTKEYSTVFRLGEQYLIRAEARIQQNKLSEGIADLNVIRRRATDLRANPDNQLPQLLDSLSKDEAMIALIHERKCELFTEWGHRWFDLKRLNTIDKELLKVKTSWQSTDQLFPIPQNEVTQNPNIRGHQNPGYN